MAGPFEKGVAILFYFLFTCTIFSPLVSGFALWLFVFVPFLSRGYLLEARYVRKNVFISLMFAVCLSSLFFMPVVTLKILFSYICVTYVIYTIKKGLFFYMHLFSMLNVIVCFIQYLVLTYFGMEVLDPAKIGSFVYGSFALTTGDTFAPGFLFSYRVSGLNREPGFMSSLFLAGLIMLFYLTKKGSQYRRSHHYILLGAYLLGLALTFSKVTLALACALPLAHLFRGWVRRLGPDLVTVLFLLVMCFAVTVFYNFSQLQHYPQDFYHGLSIYHRTIGYYVLADLEFMDLMLGIGNDVSGLAKELVYIKNSEWWGYDRLIFDNSGLSQLVISFGVIIIMPFLFFLRACGVDGYRWLVFLLMTVSVNPLTSTSFVILSLVLAFSQQRKRIN